MWIFYYKSYTFDLFKAYVLARFPSVNVELRSGCVANPPLCKCVQLPVGGALGCSAVVCVDRPRCSGRPCPPCVPVLLVFLITHS